MPFWGIEVKPGKSYAYSSDSARRKLRITQASIGTGKSIARSTLQINVGDKKPIILCNLLPNVSENFNMELEFEESEDVIFSVLGERSVHLAGYLIESPDCKLDGNDSDSIGEDIAHTESSGSYDDCSDLDKYESDFIDDNDDITNSPSPRSTSKERQETSFRRLKKTYQASDSDDYKSLVGTKTNSIFNVESDDSDDSSLLSFKEKKNEKKKSKANVSLNTDNPREVVGDAKETAHVSESPQSKETKTAEESKEKKKKKNKKSKEEKAIVVSPSVVEDDQNISALPDENAHDETGKRKKANKQKETSEKDETGMEDQNQCAVTDKNDHDETGKKKKAKKQKETIEVDETGIVEEDLNLSVVPDKNAHDETSKKKKTKKQKETGDVDENGIVDEHQNLSAGPDKNEHDETDKRKQAKKQKETSEVDSTDNPPVSKAIYSENDGVGKKKRKAKKHEETIETKMDENPLVSKATDSEVSVVPSDTTQRNGKKGNKKSKKRTKDERHCDSEVADADYSDAKKLKKENSRNDDIK